MIKNIVIHVAGVLLTFLSISGSAVYNASIDRRKTGIRAQLFLILEYGSMGGNA